MQITAHNSSQCDVAGYHKTNAVAQSNQTRAAQSNANANANANAVSWPISLEGNVL
jgi:hypothetical protein